MPVDDWTRVQHHWTRAPGTLGSQRASRVSKSHPLSIQKGNKGPMGAHGQPMLQPAPRPLTIHRFRTGVTWPHGPSSRRKYFPPPPEGRLGSMGLAGRPRAHFDAVVQKQEIHFQNLDPGFLSPK